MIAPILDEVAKEYGGKLQIAKMNVDDNQAIPAKFGIRGIPTLILFKNGAAAAQKVGALSKGQLARSSTATSDVISDGGARAAVRPAQQAGLDPRLTPRNSLPHLYLSRPGTLICTYQN
jgi:thioredoxin-like negative regulator of GroEL